MVFRRRKCQGTERGRRTEHSKAFLKESAKAETSILALKELNRAMAVIKLNLDASAEGYRAVVGAALASNPVALGEYDLTIKLPPISP